MYVVNGIPLAAQMTGIAQRREEVTLHDVLSSELGNSLEGLINRYEEPSSMVRWDSPLFTVTWTDEDIPGDEIWQAVTEGTVKPPNAGTTAVCLSTNAASYR